MLPVTDAQGLTGIQQDPPATAGLFVSAGTAPGDARGTVVSHASFRIVQVGVPIQILGVELKPGDMLHGDENGLTRGTTAGHIARAALEGIAFQVADVLEVMREDSGIPMRELRVDGGASANNLLMQSQADLLQVPVVRPKVAETTALGAACLAGLAVGFWKDRMEVSRAWQPDRTFEPAKGPNEVAHRRSRWAEALNRAREWEQRTQVKLFNG